jgi:hypothetical protein
LRATVTPFDNNNGAGACTDILHFFHHESTLRFDRAGEATVVFRGARQPEDETIAVERTVVVK